MMRAAVIETPGGPEVLTLKDVPRPEPAAGQVLIRIHAFGLNRAEHFTREGHSGAAVQFPRIIGIECVGEVEAAPDTRFVPGQRVAAMMGGMGRKYDGSYAQFTRVPAEHVFALETKLDWSILGAIPEMLQTTHGSLTAGLECERAASILIRGGTSSIGMTAAILAKDMGLTVASTTRSEHKAELLRRNGVDHVLLDDGGSLADKVRAIFPGGVDRVLELVGTTTLIDSMRATRPGGIVCMTGILGGAWELPAFRPMEHIPHAVKLTCYSGGSMDITEAQLQQFVARVEAKTLPISIAKSFTLEDIQEAHRAMDSNALAGKIVVTVSHHHGHHHRRETSSQS